jgi:hypothetical protein
MLLKHNRLLGLVTAGLAAAVIAPVSVMAQPIDGQVVTARADGGITPTNLISPDRADRLTGARLDHRGLRYSAPATTAPQWPLNPQPLPPGEHTTTAEPVDDGSLDTWIWIAVGGGALLATGGLGLVGRKRLRQLA